MTNPVDTAKPGDCFRDANGVTWLLTEDNISRPWVTSRRMFHSHEEAREANLTPIVPPSDGARPRDSRWISVPPVDASDPAQLRHAAAVLDLLRARAGAEQRELAVAARIAVGRANRLDTDAADQALAEKVARKTWAEHLDQVGEAEWDQLPSSWQAEKIDIALAGIRAGRAAKAAE